jgi:hypothetical protein
VISRSSIKLLDCTTALDAKLLSLFFFAAFFPFCFCRHLCNGRCVCNVQKHPLPAGGAVAIGAARAVLAPLEFCTQCDDSNSTNRRGEEKTAKALLVARWKTQGDS